MTTKLEAPLLEIKNLKTHFLTKRVVRAVDIDHLAIQKGEIVGLVGESGCGKSMTSLSILRLVPEPGRIISGEIIFKGQDLLKKTEREMRQIRGGSIAMIFQEPMTSLNPCYTIENQMVEAIILHRKLSKKDSRAVALDMLSKVGMPDPKRILKEYPHQLSGGMQQRVMVAMAMCCEPELLIADEPTTALDVTIQAQVLELMRNTIGKTGVSVLLITHNLGVVNWLCQKAAVMYAGEIVEFATVQDLIADAKHPYTIGLLGAVPSLDENLAELRSIPGAVPDLSDPPAGCKFHPRCDLAKKICSAVAPPVVQMQGDSGERLVRCHSYG